MASCLRRLHVVLLVLLGLVSPGCANDPSTTGQRTHATSAALPKPTSAALPKPTSAALPKPTSAALPKPTSAALPKPTRPRPFVESDVVLVIDHSTVALLASGVDVDKNGVVGRNRSRLDEKQSIPILGPFWTSDSGDTLHELQLAVSRALIPRLAARKNRVGLASFNLRSRTQATSKARLNDKPRVVVPVGPADAVVAALADFPAARERRRTDLARLLELSATLLDQAPPGPVRDRPRTILLLSLGRPSAPDGIHWASQRALKFAGELEQRNIAIWAVPFGGADIGYLEELTQRTGGNVVRIDELDALLRVPSPITDSATSAR